ncbi:MAG: hypothetical protein IPK46_22340 [Saprospiraceae bacterium]|nr:hypothetical protein [Saprospiraceae bacterium]
MPILRFGVAFILFFPPVLLRIMIVTPAYLLLSDPAITVRSDEGAPVSSIQDAWVIVDGQLLGVFPLPAKVPVIPTGKEMSIQINAGIKENADRNISAEYPFLPASENNIVHGRR